MTALIYICIVEQNKYKNRKFLVKSGREKGVNVEACDPARSSKSITLGARSIDERIGSGLARGALHEVFASGHGDITTAAGFALALACRAAGKRSILVVRQSVLDGEIGHLNGPGLLELGLDPARVILVKAGDAEGALRAGEQAARCAALGAVLMELWGEPKALGFTASRRLSLASARSGVPILLLRVSASPAQSAAATRWSVQALPSHALEANAPGFPAFELNLLRQRGGADGQTWRVEWDRDQKCFQERPCFDAAPVPRFVVSISHNRPASLPAPQSEFRKAQ